MLSANIISTKYTITWIVDSVETTEEYEHGEMPEFKGITDKSSDSEYTYTFDGWNKELSAVTGDVTYAAQYNQTENAAVETTTALVQSSLTTQETEKKSGCKSLMTGGTFIIVMCCMATIGISLRRKIA